MGAGGAVAVGSVAGRVEVARGVTGAEVTTSGVFDSAVAGAATTTAGAVAGDVEISGEDAEGVAAGMFAAGALVGTGVEAAEGGATLGLVSLLAAARFG